ncbi:MAG TPA: ATP-binding protein [Verrucomicrobiota bacterium]|nr:ATP-binding protein [Verrucomicrobiota bacterium]HNU50302.1 ATP-binding protein [Verrucomicrobiota bacterium]
MWLAISILLAVALALSHWAWRRHSARREHYWQDRLADANRLHEAQIAEDRTRHEALFHQMVEGVLVLDRQGRILMANPALLRLAHCTVDPKGRPWIEVIRAHELDALLAELARDGVIRARVLRLPGPTEPWVEINAVALPDGDGPSRGFLLVIHDVTRLRQLENTGQEIVANVSHELRTPLSLIKGYVESLLDGAKDNPDLNEKFLRTIDRNVDRLCRLIEDLLVISELRSGRRQIDLDRVELRPLADQVLDELATRAADRRVQLLNRIPSLEVLADPDRIHQVLLNLVDNAVKYGRPGGCVTLSTEALSPEQIEVCVADDGPGLAREVLPHLFQPFYRADKARSREQGGTGLGLSIVRHIVELHGGAARVESEPGQGARFFFTLRTPPA